MTLMDFENTLSASDPPPQLTSPVLIALWYDGKGDWNAAHEIAQGREGVREYDRLHAYLHRVEGDEWNAGYWYRKAGESYPEMGLKEEWRMMVKKMLN